MKHQTVAAFEKHLRSAAPDHLAPIYMIVTSCPFERRKMAEKVLAYFPGISLTTCEEPPDLQTPSLFGGKSAIFWDGLDQIKNLSLPRPHPAILLLLGSAAMKPVADLYQKGKKEMVVLDLSEEKPWERKRRLQEWLIDEAKKNGKTLRPKAAETLLDHIGLDAAGILQELAKLICYTGGRPEISESDITAISATRDLSSGWSLSENVVLEGGVVSRDKSADLSFLLPFIGQLRYHLQNGLQVAEALESNTPPPQIRNLDKYAVCARRRTSAYFRRGLSSLYDLEVGAKSGSTDLSLLFDCFCARLRI